MLPPERPDRIHIAFDDHRLVAMSDCCFRPECTRRPAPAEGSVAQARTTVLKRCFQTSKVFQTVLARQNTLGYFRRNSREPDLRVLCSICQRAVAAK